MESSPIAGATSMFHSYALRSGDQFGMEVQNAGQLKNIFDEKNPVHIGFKTAFYEYTEQNEK